MNTTSPKLLFVCLGNICRSPMAEGIFRHKAQEMGIEIETDSCGTGGWHAGESPDGRAQGCMRDHGMNIGDLRARKFSPADFDRFDVIFTMDTSNHGDVLSLASSDKQAQKVKLMLNEIYPGEDTSVPDPYFGGDEGFEHVFDLLTRSADKVLSELQAR